MELMFLFQMNINNLRNLMWGHNKIINKKLNYSQVK